MKVNKTVKILIIFYSTIIVLGVIIAIISYNILNNPIDMISITYLRRDTNIEDEYGEIVHIGKNVFHKTKKDESTIISPYTIETQNERIVVYVTLTKNKEEWTAVSYEIVEVRPNE